jgi:hypothetical protein
LDALRAEQDEIEGSLRSQIQMSLVQLKGLRECQEYRSQIEIQRRQITAMIASDKKEHANEMSQIHHQLVDQREFYEEQLASKLGAAEEFAGDFAELHIDNLTGKIQKETWTFETQFRNENAELYQALKDNENLRATLTKLRQQGKIRSGCVDKVDKEADKLEKELEDLERQSARPRNVVSDVEEAFSAKVVRMRNFLEEQHNENISLKKDVALLTARLAALEAESTDRQAEGSDLLSAVKESSALILAKLNETQGELPKNEQISKLSPFAQLVQRLGSLPPAAKTREISIVDVMDVEVQTDKVERLVPGVKYPFAGRYVQNSVSRKSTWSARSSGRNQLLEQVKNMKEEAAGNGVVRILRTPRRAQK